MLTELVGHERLCPDAVDDPQHASPNWGSACWQSEESAAQRLPIVTVPSARFQLAGQDFEQVETADIDIIDRMTSLPLADDAVLFEKCGSKLLDDAIGHAGTKGWAGSQPKAAAVDVDDGILY